MVCQHLKHFHSRKGRLLLKLGRDIRVVERGAESVVVYDSLVVHKVYHAGEAVFNSDGKLNGNGLGSEALAHLINDCGEICADSVHFVDERYPGHSVLISLTPYGLGLRLNSADGAEYRNSAVENAHGTLDFYSKVHVPGRINDIDQAIVPETGSSGRSNGNATFALLLHPVHRCGAFMRLAELVFAAGIEQDTLCSRRLTRIYMRSYSYIAHFA